MNKQYGIAILLALAVFLIAACGSPVATAVPTVAPTAVPVVVPTDTPPPPTSTTAPTNTPVPTAIITVPTNTPAPAATPVPTPTINLATLRSDDPPHIFVGTAKIDGVAAPRGTDIWVMIGDQIAASGRVGSNGEFTTILVDIPGYPVTFMVGDYAASQPAIKTEKGGATPLELNASSR